MVTGLCDATVCGAIRVLVHDDGMAADGAKAELSYQGCSAAHLPWWYMLIVDRFHKDLEFELLEPNSNISHIS